MSNFYDNLNAKDKKEFILGFATIIILIVPLVYFSIIKTKSVGEAGLIVLFLVSIIISIIYYANAEEIKQEVKEQTKTLSEKYDVLEIYKGLAFLLMIVATGFFIYSLVQFFDAPKVAREMLENAMITSTITYTITMFSLFCLTKMIDFLFDLDKK